MNVAYFNSQVEKDLYTLEEISLTKSLRLIDLLGLFGSNLTMPYSKKIASNLYELRVRGKQEIRILYCFYQDKAVIVHHFVKKSQKTPRKEIETALHRISLLP